MRTSPRLRLIAALIAAGLPAVPALAQPAQPGITEVDALRPVAQVPGCGERALPKARHPRLSAEAFRTMRDYSDGLGGVALMVMREGRVEHEHYAGAHGPATRTMSHSMHKSVLGLATGIAIRDGVLPDVAQPIGEALSAWKDDPRGRIPLRSFLTMSSGLKLYSLGRREPEAARLVMGPGIDAVALATPIDALADSIFKYNNANSQIIGIALREGLKARGQPDYPAWLSQRLWCPLGNAPASLWVDDQGAPRFFAGLQATARDWARIGQMMLDRGRVGRKQIVPADWIAQMAAPSAANPAYGYQVWRGSPWQEKRAYSPDNPITVPHKEAYLADDVLFFDGFGGQRVYIVPSARLVIVRTGEPSMAFDDSVLVNIALRGLRRSGRGAPS